MKKVLITGANSYVGTSVEKWLMKEPDKYYVETLDMKNANWRDFDFSKFDVVFHVAGIAHVSTKKNLKDLYFKINRDLAIETAQKAKESGVKHFLFMSSMIVYNSKETRITNETKPNPDNFYGLSKLLAEEGIIRIESEKFKVCILRPPMIYGDTNKGNVEKILKLTKTIRVFPRYQNKKSFIDILQLNQLVKKYIDQAEKGIQFPSNTEPVSTFEFIRQMQLKNSVRIKGIRIFNPLINIFKKRFNILNKVFGDHFYDIK